LVFVKSHAEMEGRKITAGMDVEGFDALVRRFHPAAGVPQGAHKALTARTAGGGQLDRPSVRDEGIIDLAGG
jgi:hypothetical protein